MKQTLWTTIRLEIFSFSTFLLSIFLGIVYLFAIQLLLNYKLLLASFSYHYSSRLSLLYSLFLGSFTSLSAEPFPFFVLMINAFFVGLNIILLTKAVGQLGGKGKVHVSLGGATLFSLVTAGCASCGLSLLSLLGLSATLSFLPFHGAELRVISLGLLIISALYMLKQLHEAKYCRI